LTILIIIFRYNLDLKNLLFFVYAFWLYGGSFLHSFFAEFILTPNSQEMREYLWCMICVPAPANSLLLALLRHPFRGNLV